LENNTSKQQEGIAMNGMRKMCKGLLCSMLVLGLIGTSFGAPKQAVKKGLELSPLISDGMVLQRDTDCLIWGKALPKTTVTVSLDGKTLNTTADVNGKWEVSYPAHKFGGPYVLSITTGNGEEKMISGVLFGDIWVCSGQSNMEMPVATGWGHVKNYDAETAAAHYPLLKLITVPESVSALPEDSFKSDGWEAATPESVAKFSATAYFFGRDLHHDLQIPIGLIHTSWGGTPIESWMSPNCLLKFPEFEKEIANRDTTPINVKLAAKDYEIAKTKWDAKLEASDLGKTGKEFTWNKADFNDADWKTMAIPNTWEGEGLPDFDGMVWFRKTIEIPANWAGKDITLKLGPVDDRDLTYFNGTLVGSDIYWDKPRVYTIPGKLVKAGKNILAVRVLDTAGSGGIYGGKDPMELISADSTLKPISIAGDWKYKVSINLAEFVAPPVDPNNPYLKGGLFNAMINPLLKYKIKGAIWYQGEANAGNAYKYRSYFPTMIEDWRSQWNEKDFPFLYVQLANYLEPVAKPEEDDWAELREAQLMTLAVPSTAMAVIIDAGETWDIHPKNKQVVGNRLALAARAMVYGEKLEYSGPIYHSFKYEEGGKVRIFFTHTGEGLAAADTTVDGLKEFAIAGADKKFVWAKARIEGDSVLVWSDEVKDPVAVRYGWTNNPACNLYNIEGLPASPFRTDTWPGITFPKVTN
jgi:sialate O-acetylesterase